MEFDWDYDKNRSNNEKHGIDFNDAKEVFKDDNSKVAPDLRKDYGEDRLKIIGKIYSKIGILSKGTFRKVTRADLISGYLGQTALKTRDVIKDCLGGVLFIDEAYALGNNEKRDSFSKECIDTINQNLTENKETIVFIAGYKDQLNESFFSYNPGLNRRFKMRMTVDVYNAKDLREIYIKKIKENNYNRNNLLVSLFKKYISKKEK